MVFSWGDGDFGKLGRGGSEGCAVPANVEKLNGMGIMQIECGAQFSLALSKTGVVWTWGKGDYFRLGEFYYYTYRVFMLSSRQKKCAKSLPLILIINYLQVMELISM